MKPGVVPSLVRSPRFGDDWWRRGVVYRIYQRTFAASDGDGVGDLLGIIDNLDHLGAAARHLASRSRRRVQEGAPKPDADLAVQRRVVGAFLVAARSGDFDALLLVLDPDVVFRTDGGGVEPLARPPVVGAVEAARRIQATGGRFAGLAKPAILNGAVGAIVEAPYNRPSSSDSRSWAAGSSPSISSVIRPSSAGSISAEAMPDYRPRSVLRRS